MGCGFQIRYYYAADFKSTATGVEYLFHYQRFNH